jgi:hypothetical protein
VQFLYVVEERRIGFQSGELLEEQCAFAIVLQQVTRKLFNRAVEVDERSGCLRSVARNSGITIRRVAHESEVVRNVFGRDPKLHPHSFRIANHATSSVHLHHAIFDDALCQVFVGRPDTNLLYALIQRRKMCCRSECVVGFEFNHRPNGHAHRHQRLFQWVKLRAQYPFDAGSGFVVGPQTIAKRFDDVISCDADMRSAVLNHFHYCV